MKCVKCNAAIPDKDIFAASKGSYTICLSCQKEQSPTEEKAPLQNELALSVQAENKPTVLNTPEKKLQEGKRLNDEGKYFEAIEAFEDAILADYKTDQGYYGLHVAYKALGRDIEAQEALNRSRPSVYSNKSLEPSESEIKDFASKKVVAGVFGILLGFLGVHKFILGFTAAGVTMLLLTVLTCGYGAFPIGIIGLIEGIIYLSKSDKDFYQIYCVNRRSWF